MKHRIPYLTVYAFSSENWNRPNLEVKQLLDLFMRALTREVRELDEHDVRIRFIGDRGLQPRPARWHAPGRTSAPAATSALLLNVAVNYGGRATSSRPARELAEAVGRQIVEPADIDENTLASHLYLTDTPARTC
jgi:undecaprenyl diphosphate synthase